MSTPFLDLAPYDRFSVDTETTGVSFSDRPVGLSVATPDGKKTYLRWGHEQGGNNCSLADVIRWSRVEFARRDRLCVMHNAGFDLRMLAYVGIDVKGRVEDTGFVAALLNELEPDLSLDGLGERHAGVRKDDGQLNERCAKMFGGQATRNSQVKNYWRAPGDVVEAYAEQDAVVTLALYDALRPQLADEGLDTIYETETALIPLLLKMHLTGVRVDVDRAVKLKRELSVKLDQLRARWASEVGDVNYNSTQQLADVFRRLGLPVAETEKGNPSITKDHLAVMNHPVPNLVQEMKRLEKFTGTFIDNYLLKNVTDQGLIHGEFHPLRTSRYGTVSGRFSSGGALNLQNIPARDEEVAPLIRGMFIPYRDDLQWLKADYSQIEYRFLAHYGGGNLALAYNEQPDIDFHQMCADLVGIPRKPAKNINFGLVYGMGEALMAQKLGLPLHEARELFAQYHGRVPEVRRLYKKADRRAAARGYIRTWGGRKRRFKRANSGRHLHTHKALNALLQGSAADLIKLAMVRLASEVNWQDILMHLTVHDEVDLSVPKGETGTRFARRVKELLEDYRLEVPVKADVELGPDWGHTLELAA